MSNEQMTEVVVVTTCLKTDTEDMNYFAKHVSRLYLDIDVTDDKALQQWWKYLSDYEHCVEASHHEE